MTRTTSGNRIEELWALWGLCPEWGMVGLRLLCMKTALDKTGAVFYYANAPLCSFRKIKSTRRSLYQKKHLFGCLFCSTSPTMPLSKSPFFGTFFLDKKQEKRYNYFGKRGFAKIISKNKGTLLEAR